ncbi:DNA-binding transcription factor [Parahypoxylon ruwenzoriense]
MANARHHVQWQPAVKGFMRDIKGNLAWHVREPSSMPVPPVPSKTIARNAAEDEANEVYFSTHIDTLMKVIQFKHEPDTVSNLGDAAYPSPPNVDHDKLNLRRKSCSPDDASTTSDQSGKERHKRYICDIKGCGKQCSQKTQLETHKRAHTGEKPYVCQEPGCGLQFSQRGNMKSHGRIHTGEKPFVCDICGKAFAQRGNLKPHRLTHSKVKPFRCIFDGCLKTFGQRGNLKNHHNKFHADKIQELTQKFGNLPPGINLNDHDQNLFIHFAELYKNSNKGIKGRGKDRIFSTKSKKLSVLGAPRHYSVQSLPPVHHQMHQSHRLPSQHGLPYSDDFGGSSMPRNNSPGNNMVASREQHAAYGLYDMDQASVSSSDNTVTASNSPGTIYEEDHGRAYGYQQHRLY